MNKREVIEKIKNDNSLTGGLVEKSWAIYCIEQIHEPKKVVIPKFVAEWIESKKEYFSDSSAIYMYDNLTLDNNGGYYHDVWLWAIAHHHDFIKAWHDGYEVEKEPLYTVAIPNPNGDSNRYGLCKEDGKIIIGSFVFGLNKAINTKLTESEIRKDFEWAWQFAVPVEGENGD